MSLLALFLFIYLSIYSLLFGICITKRLWNADANTTLSQQKYG